MRFELTIQGAPSLTLTICLLTSGYTPTDAICVLYRPGMHQSLVLRLLVTESLSRPATWSASPSSKPKIGTQSRAYGENSPSLWPTMSSVTRNSWYILPLCTWNFRPTKFGSMVADRACVLIGGTCSPGLGRTIGRREGS